MSTRNQKEAGVKNTQFSPLYGDTNAWLSYFSKTNKNKWKSFYTITERDSTGPTSTSGQPLELVTPTAQDYDRSKKLQKNDNADLTNIKDTEMDFMVGAGATPSKPLVSVDLKRARAKLNLDSNPTFVADMSLKANDAPQVENNSSVIKTPHTKRKHTQESELISPPSPKRKTYKGKKTPMPLFI